MEIGRRIKELMRDRRVSAKELAQSTGIPASTIAQWINYNQEPKATALLRVAKFFGVQVEYIISGEAPEVSMAKEMLSKLDKKWISLHQGVYRIRVEKQIEVPLQQKKKKRGEP